MLSIREVRKLSSRLKVDKFVREIGPFVLIQKPPPEALARHATMMMGQMPQGAQSTQIARPDKLTNDVLGLLFQFEDLSIATLPPMEGGGELTVGRAPDCDLVLDDASVSKVHAVLRWDDAKKQCTLVDAGSTNGTYLNASIRLHRAVVLRDGDIISFGEVPFWYLLSPTLFDRLRSYR